MSISIEEVNRIAKLSRLTFEESEKPKLQQELSSILDYVSQVQELQGRGELLEIEDPSGVNLMREDVAISIPDRQKFIAQAPGLQDGFVKVKSIME